MYSGWQNNEAAICSSGSNDTLNVQKNAYQVCGGLEGCSARVEGRGAEDGGFKFSSSAEKAACGGRASCQIEITLSSVGPFFQ